MLRLMLAHSIPADSAFHECRILNPPTICQREALSLRERVARTFYARRMRAGLDISFILALTRAACSVSKIVVPKMNSAQNAILASR